MAAHGVCRRGPEWSYNGKCIDCENYRANSAVEIAQQLERLQRSGSCRTYVRLHTGGTHAVHSGTVCRRRKSVCKCLRVLPERTNEAGDDATGSDTSCRALLCAANEKVTKNECVACPPGSTNAAGDDAVVGTQNAMPRYAQRTRFKIIPVWPVRWCHNVAGDDASMGNSFVMAGCVQSIKVQGSSVRNVFQEW